MKKMIIFLGLILGLFAVLYFVNQASLRAQDDNVYGIPASKLNSMTVKQLKDPNYQNIILPADLKKKLDAKGSQLVYFFSPTCPHCVATTPFLAPLAKEMGVDMKMYNVLEFDQGWADYKLTVTPTLVYYKEGKEVERIEGGFNMVNGKPSDDSYQKFKAFLTKYKG
ncbi:thioredoxin family protein [Gorillibacterium sp. sgz5001074]|uniref:thioredoxin family protein n=1 Tax=Gorillibacterium sp. sgz5001074 TaxID=3446695 RepID=UPI003F670A60